MRNFFDIYSRGGKAVSKFSFIDYAKVKTLGHRFRIPRGNKLWHMCGAHVPKIGTLIYLVKFP